MIIECQSCNKKFHINRKLIPEKGRLLQCGSCNHKWFFKNKISIKTIKTQSNDSLQIFEAVKEHADNPIDDDNNTTINSKITIPREKIVEKVANNNIKTEKKSNFFNLSVVYIVSFVGLVILLDTFKSPLIKIYPRLEFLLYNLYESIKVIELFIKDLI